jgi:hypothetical protein
MLIIIIGKTEKKRNYETKLSESVGEFCSNHGYFFGYKPCVFGLSVENTVSIFGVTDYGLGKGGIGNLSITIHINRVQLPITWR